jgi:hypothetical protein
MNTKQTGYYTLPNGQNLHFSINAWYILEEETGYKPQEFLADLIEESSRKEPNEFTLLTLLSDLTFAACKAYDLEEGNEVTYNRFKIRSMVANLGGEGIKDLNDSLINNSTVDYSLGKTMAQ